MSEKSPDSHRLFTPLTPYTDMDLSSVVTHINRSTKRARERCANDAVTRGFLNAAMALMEELFSGAATDKSGEDSRPTMKFLARNQVLAKAEELSPNMRLTIGQFRDRWANQQFFVADFIAYALMERHWSLHTALSERAKVLLTEKSDFIGSVHEVAYQDLMVVLELPAYRFQLVAAASAETDPIASDALCKMYDTLNATWCTLYDAVFTRYGLKFRPGCSMKQLNILLQSVAEGLGLRLLAGTDENIFDHGKRTSLLGTAALALLVAFVDPGDGRSFDELVYRHFDASSSPKGGPLGVDR